MIGKADAQYRENPGGTKRCIFCAMFVLPSSCTLVAGKIKATGVCRYWDNMLTGKGKPDE